MTKVLSVGENTNYSRQVVLVNPSDREWSIHNFVLWFGSCGTTYLRVWSSGIEGALEAAAEWLTENDPGHLTKHNSEELQELLAEEYKDRGINPDDPISEEEFQSIFDAATVDLTYTEAGWITSYEWGICLEDPTRQQFLEFVGKP